MKGFYYIKKGPDIMRAKQVNLRQEVTRNDALMIMNWMENNEVVKYLNEDAHVSSEIKQAIDRVNMYIMTHLFNREGSFFLINLSDDRPIGFLKLIRKINEAEMVIVIGDQNKWGYGIGKSSIVQGLNIAFFQWRLQRVVAKIDKDNIRSLRAFERVGFRLEKEIGNFMHYSISMDDFIKKSLSRI